MKRLLCLLAAVCWLPYARAQTELLGDTSLDAVYSSFFNQQGNAAATFQGLNLYHGSHYWRSETLTNTFTTKSLIAPVIIGATSFSYTNTGGTALYINSVADIGSSSTIVWQKARGTTSSLVIPNSGDTLGGLVARGYSAAGVAYKDSSYILMWLNGEPDTAGDSTDMPGAISFYTAADGSATPSERVRISSAGVTTAYGELRVNGATANRVAVFDANNGLVPARVTTNQLDSFADQVTQSRGGVYFGSAGQAVSTWSGQQVGAGDFTVTVLFTMPASNGASRYVFGMGGAAWAGTFLINIDSNGAMYLRLYDGASNYRGKWFSAGSYAGQRIFLTAVRIASTPTLKVYLNQDEVSVSDFTLGTPPTYAMAVLNDTMRFGNYGGSPLISDVEGVWIFNRALSASEVPLLIRQGVAMADRWGSMTGLVTGTDSTFAGAGNWVSSGLTTWDVNTTVSGKGYALTPSSGAAKVTLASKLTVGKRYLVTVKHRLNAGTGTAWTIGSDSTTAGASVTFTPAGTEATASGEFLADTTSLALKVASSNSSAYEFDDVTCIQIGCLADYDLAVGNGYQLPDRSANRLDALASTSDATHLFPSLRPGVLRTAVAADGYLGDATDRPCLPAKARIESITAYSTGTPTFTIGDDSGSAANVVASVSLSASTPTDLTLLKRFLTTGTDGRLYVDFTAGAATTWFTVNYTLAEQ